METIGDDSGPVFIRYHYSQKMAQSLGPRPVVEAQPAPFPPQRHNAPGSRALFEAYNIARELITGQCLICGLLRGNKGEQHDAKVESVINSAHCRFPILTHSRWFLPSLQSMLQTMKRVVHYLANLEWTERPQKECIFCNYENFKIIDENELSIAIDNIRSGGERHWLIMPKPSNPDTSELHIRDIENLNSSHLPLLQSMDELKRRLLNKHYADVPLSEIHSGYHRGRRHLIWKIFYPDIISIHHLHLHVIVQPQPLLKWLKYPPWLPLMWKSDEKVLQEVEKLAWKKR
ncbi:hypothetical protein GGI35DRAFT_457430 [Trichoderma velutinum]